MKKIDLKKEFKQLYSVKNTPVIISVPEFNYIMTDGEGNPNSVLFQELTQALYAISYTLKFAIKKQFDMDYVVMPLEGIWWAHDMDAFKEENKDNWKWTIMILQPEEVTKEIFQNAINEVKKKKKDLKYIDNLRLESINEKKAAHILHTGPYSEEYPTIEKLHNFIKENNLNFSGKHREIYLSDPRKTAPEKMKTIIRQPVE